MFPLLAAPPAFICMPEPAKSILTAGHQHLPIWAEGDREDARFMLFQLSKQPASW